MADAFFGHTYYGVSYFGPAYFGTGGTSPPPVPPPPPCATDRLNVVIPTTSVFGTPTAGKLRGVAVRQGIPVSLTLPFYDPSGRAVLFSSGGYCDTVTLVARFREASGFPTIYQVDAGADLYFNADYSAATVNVPDCVLDLPGVFHLEVAVTDTDLRPKWSNRAVVYVERGLYLTDGSPCTADGAPTPDELRLAIRDYPAANRLTQDYEFDIAELGESVARATNDFNSAPPPVQWRAVTYNWVPEWRPNLIDGVIRYMYETAAAYYRRSQLPLATGGVSIDDMNKEREYLAAANYFRDRFERWVKFTKTRMNMAAGFGTARSIYSRLQP